MLGEKLKISIFGHSHGKAIGVVIDGLPPGETIDIDELNAFMKRRAPGGKSYTTPRKEADEPIILSGLIDNKTCGAPLCAMIENKDMRSQDYKRDIPRPGHADYTAHIKYKGYNDAAGGGHFSGRLTAPLCIAGGICLQILKRRDIYIGSHIYSIGQIKDIPFNPVTVSPRELELVATKKFPVNHEPLGEKMLQEILEASKDLDSIGGVIEACILGLPEGIGEPIFGGLENRLSSAIFGIPAVKGLEFGSGFQGSLMKGSENNDAFIIKDGKITLETNNSGGILGGISTGMPVILRAAIKPTPSIKRPQKSISLSEEEERILEIQGRHDPCIAPRAVPCIEAAAAIVILDMLL